MTLSRVLLWWLCVHVCGCDSLLGWACLPSLEKSGGSEAECDSPVLKQGKSEGLSRVTMETAAGFLLTSLAGPGV